MAVPLEPPSSKPGHRTRNRVIIAVVVAVAVVAVLVPLYTVPITHPFSFTLVRSGVVPPPPPPAVDRIFPHGSHVWGDFVAIGGSVDFEITGSNGDLVCCDNTTSGSFDFTASSEVYTFYAGSFAFGETVYVWGNYTSTIFFV
ncbi:MAG: hypothetical protein WBW47_06000 [Thermoplasmata archaeon]